MYVIGLLLIFGLLGAFALQNAGAQDFNLFGYVMDVPIWAPATAGVVLVSLLLVVHTAYTRLRHGFHRVGYQHRVDRHRRLIAELRVQNALLREEVAGLRAANGARAAAAPPSSPAEPAAQVGGAVPPRK